MKLLMLLALTASMGGAGLAGWHATRPAPLDHVPETVTLAPGPYAWRPSGDWTRDGRPVDPPMLARRADRPLAVMKYQVTGAEYRICVAEGACRQTRPTPATVPQAFVNWRDAEDYARWLSKRTGQAWRLPTEEEWQRFAAERFVDDARGTADDPGERLLASYRRNVSDRARNTSLQPPGAFGENALGIGDLAGNVWEWTSTCLLSGHLDAAGQPSVDDEYCGARVAAGQHRARVIDFVRDARAGGCGAGLPPDFLGIRLVREIRR